MSSLQVAAHKAVAAALKAGTLTPEACEVCAAQPEGTPHPTNNVRPLAHHDDYSKPLDVRWLCRQHHADHHRSQGAYANNGRRAGAA